MQAWLAKAGVLEGTAAPLGSDSKPAAGDHKLLGQRLVASCSHEICARVGPCWTVHACCSAGSQGVLPSWCIEPMPIAPHGLRSHCEY
jgi:hypothetical protein